MKKEHWIAVLSGSCSMGLELAGTKMAEPFFGTGIEVWSAGISAVMAGFIAGYWAGSYLSLKNENSKWLSISGLASAFFISLSLLLGNQILETCYNLFDLYGIIPAAFLILFPGIAFVSAMNPLLVHSITRGGNEAGKASGTIYGISTLAGVASLIVTGFFLLPSAGVGLSLCLVAVLPMACFFICMDFRKEKRMIYLSLVPLLLLIFSAVKFISPLPDDILYKKSGLSGELMVADIPLGKEPRRLLFHNRIAQTNMYIPLGVSMWDYSHFLSTLSGMKPKGSRFLLLGLAGGNIANELLLHHFSVDAVDLDSRVGELARKFFGLSPHCSVFYDDARHYIRTTKQKYDGIVFDLFSGEGHPPHILTAENLAEIKKILNPGGLLLINVHGFTEGDAGRGIRSLWKTLRESGFKTYYLHTPGVPAERNTEILATQQSLPSQYQELFRMNECCKMVLRGKLPVLREVLQPDTENSMILTDDKPIMEHLNREAYKAWRKYAIGHYLLDLRQKGVPYF